MLRGEILGNDVSFFSSLYLEHDSIIPTRSNDPTMFEYLEHV
jgi:hypothetical protein